MKFKTGLELLAGLLVTLGLLQPLQAQRESSNPDQKEKTENSAIRIGLGSTSGTPGTIVVVPIYLTLRESVKVGKLKVEVNYVSANMKFVKVDSGITTKSANVDLASDVTDGKNDKSLKDIAQEVGTSASEIKQGINEVKINASAGDNSQTPA